MPDFDNLDRRLRIERATTTPNAFNEPVETWSLFANVSAAKVDVSDAEQLRAAAVGATLTTRFLIRWTRTMAGVTAKFRGVCEGRTYEFTGVKDLGRREGIEITAVTQVDLRNVGDL